MLICDYAMRNENVVSSIILNNNAASNCGAIIGGPVQYRWMYPIERYVNSQFSIF